MSEPMVEYRENAWWIVEHRPGTEVHLPFLNPDQCVTWGDGETYHRLLTRTDATSEAEARALATPHARRVAGRSEMMEATELQAGREIDALVAERVMGTPVVARDWPCHWDGGFFTADGMRRIGGATEGEFGPVILAESGTWPPEQWIGDDGEDWEMAWVEPVPHYSTDITAAWDVVGRMRALGFAMTMHTPGSEPWSDGATCFVEFTLSAGGLTIPNETDARSRADTASLAICRAALAAVEAP
jgi:hypothetical protein